MKIGCLVTGSFHLLFLFESLPEILGFQNCLLHLGSLNDRNSSYQEIKYQIVRNRKEMFLD